MTLEPCPYCGTAVTIQATQSVGKRGRLYYPSCNTDGCAGRETLYLTAKEAIEAANRRPHDREADIKRAESTPAGH